MTSTKSKKKQIISPYQVLSWVHYLQELIMFVFFFMINLPKSQFKTIFTVAYFANFFLFICSYFYVQTSESMHRNLHKKANNEEINWFDQVNNMVCDICDIPIKNDTKHCKRCGVCIEEFDHHCDWLNLCIGGRNYHKFFIYVVMTLIYGCLTTVALIVSALHITGHLGKEVPEIMNILAIKIVLILGILVDITVNFLLIKLLIFHLYLIKKGISTYEYIMRNRRKTSNRIHTLIVAGVGPVSTLDHRDRDESRAFRQRKGGNTRILQESEAQNKIDDSSSKARSPNNSKRRPSYFSSSSSSKKEKRDLPEITSSPSKSGNTYHSSTSKGKLHRKIELPQVSSESQSSKNIKLSKRRKKKRHLTGDGFGFQTQYGTKEELEKKRTQKEEELPGNSFDDRDRDSQVAEAPMKEKLTISRRLASPNQKQQRMTKKRGATIATIKEKRLNKDDNPKISKLSQRLIHNFKEVEPPEEGSRMTMKMRWSQEGDEQLLIAQDNKKKRRAAPNEPKIKPRVFKEDMITKELESKDFKSFEELDFDTEKEVASNSTKKKEGVFGSAGKKFSLTLQRRDSQASSSHQTGRRKQHREPRSLREFVKKESSDVTDLASRFGGGGSKKVDESLTDR